MNRQAQTPLEIQRVLDGEARQRGAAQDLAGCIRGVVGDLMAAHPSTGYYAVVSLLIEALSQGTDTHQTLMDEIAGKIGHKY